MVKLVCTNKECKKIILESNNLEKDLTEAFIQCPYCSINFKNPFKKNDRKN